MLNNVYIVAVKRTAIGSFEGSLRSLSAVDLAVPVIKKILDMLQIENENIDEVIIGNVFKAGLKGNPARQAAIKSGLHYSTPAMTIDKQCGSGLKAIILGANEIALGQADLVLTGGIESMTNVPHIHLNSRWGNRLGDLQIVDGLLYDDLHCAIEGYHMGITAENLAKKYDISREEQDEYALKSQLKSEEAIEKEKFTDEIVPIVIRDRNKEVIFSTDEHPRKTSIEKLAQLRPVFDKDGTVTAGNSSGLNDGAAIDCISF